eukprot:TRINITY_DN20593_c0_g1_i1.p1 TRINITY_DN20593_c0_g1~~TRINITY_DN20593_c0_g1_i1.p1  ORF type:complete len:1396 (+),score=167.59 TRINITY_DN20593_c0_g1_i1:166-4353(+)
MALAPPLQATCVQLCDPDGRVVRSAARDLVGHLEKASPTDLAGAFDMILAPLAARLDERSLAAPLVDDLLCSLTPLLERAAVPNDVVRGTSTSSKFRRVFPIVMERLLAVLEELLPFESKIASEQCRSEAPVASREDAAATALRCAETLMRRWYPVCDKTAEIVRMQLGYLAHMGVSFLDGGHRELRCRSAAVLRSIPRAVDDVDAMACFYPGVCIALVKVLLHGDFKLGSKVVVAACGAWQEWILRVLSDAANPACAAAVPLSLDSLFSDYNRKDQQANAAVSAQSPARTVGKLPTLTRNAVWLAETSARTGEALVAVLRPSRSSTSSALGEKSSVRRAFLDLALAVLRNCGATLTGEPTSACFEVILGGLMDIDEPNRKFAEKYLLERIGSGASFELGLRDRLWERLLAMLQELQPSPSKLDSVTAVAQRLARVNGLVRFIHQLSGRTCGDVAEFGKGGGENRKVHRLPAHCAETLLKPLLRLCTLETTALEYILADERSLASLPGTSLHGGTRPEGFVDLFPYVDTLARDVGDIASAVRKDALPIAAPAGAEGHQLWDWICRALSLADGNKTLISAMVEVVEGLLSVFNSEQLFSIVFDDSDCAWAVSSGAVDAAGPFPLHGDGCLTSGSALEAPMTVLRRSAAMFVLAVWLNGFRGATIDCSTTQAVRLMPLPPLWVARHSISLALSCISSVFGGDRAFAASPSHVLQGACALNLICASLSALEEGDRCVHNENVAGAVHSQVKHLLLPVLSCLGSTSHVASTGARAVLVHLDHLLRANQRGKVPATPSATTEASVELKGDVATLSVVADRAGSAGVVHDSGKSLADRGEDPVRALLGEYGDYVVGDICFRLKFDPASQPAATTSGGLSSVLVAVVQHVGLEMVPFLSDVVHALLLHSDVTHGVCKNRGGSASWVLRVLVSVVEQLARLICEGRVAGLCRQQTGKNECCEKMLPMPNAHCSIGGDRDDEDPGAGDGGFGLPLASDTVCNGGVSTGLAGDVHNERGSRRPLSRLTVGEPQHLAEGGCLDAVRPVSAFANFLLGVDTEWLPERRRDGFLISDLGSCLDEDPRPPDVPNEALGTNPPAPIYSRERRIAASVVLWARSHLQSHCMQARHLAHVAVVHAFTVLSTRARDLLPRVHDVWPSVVPSFDPATPVAIQATAWIVLKHTARLSGDFIRQRFVADCWPGLWTFLRDATPVAQEEAAVWSPAFKAQFAAIDVLAFVAGDSTLVMDLTERLAAIGLKFLPATRVAERLRVPVRALLQALAQAEPDLLWLCCLSLGFLAGSENQPCPELPCLREVGLDSHVSSGVSDPSPFGPEERTFLVGLLEEEHGSSPFVSPQVPRVSLSVGGQLWAVSLKNTVKSAVDTLTAADTAAATALEPAAVEGRGS